MIYYFICSNEECDGAEEFSRPMAEGPPQEVFCEKCKEKMIHELGANFILKGPGWPGKSLKVRDGEMEARDRNEAKLHEHDIKQKETNEVLTERRKGRAHWRKYQRENKQKVKNYKKNIKEGFTGTLPPQTFKI